MTTDERKHFHQCLLAVFMIGLLFGGALGAALAGRYFQKELAAARVTIRTTEATVRATAQQVQQCWAVTERRP